MLQLIACCQVPLTPQTPSCYLLLSLSLLVTLDSSVSFAGFFFLSFLPVLMIALLICLSVSLTTFLMIQRLDIRGRIKVLHGQNHKSEDPPLALFAVCTPFGPPSLLEMPQKDSMFKSKHKLDFSIVSMDPRGKQLLGYSEQDLLNRGGYDLVHYDDLAYVASAHQECKSTQYTLILLSRSPSLYFLLLHPILSCP